MKKALVVLLLILFIVNTAWALLSVGEFGVHGGINIKQNLISFYRAVETPDYTGTYWGTARSAYWTDTRTALWSTTRITEIP